MLSHLKNNRGIALPNVLIILAVLMIFLPGLYMMTTTAQMNNLKEESERKATQLAVSGMQTLVKYPTTNADKLNYLKNNYYGLLPLQIHLPEGNIVNYYQYLVPSTVQKDQVAVSTNIVDPNTIDSNSTYWVVISAVIGDSNSNKIQDSGEGFFKIKTLIGYLDPRQTAAPTINTPYVGDTFVTGTAEPNSILTLTVTSGSSNTTYTGTADFNGNYNITGLPALQLNQTISVTAQQGSRPVSLPATAIVQSKQTTPPTINAPVIDDVTITGTAVSGSTVRITVGGSTYTCTASAAGFYSVSGFPPLTQGQVIQATAELPPKAVSQAVTTVVGSKGQTGAPTINVPLYAGDTRVSGTAEPNSSITVTVGTQNFTGTAASSGSYSVGVSALINGQQVQVTARAPGKTVSPPTTTTVTSLGQTATPTINPLPAAGNTTIKGTAEPGSAISVTVASGAPITGTAGANGNYSVTVPALQLNQQIQVTAKAQGKTVSLPAKATVLATSITTGIITVVGSDGSITYVGIDQINGQLQPGQIVVSSSYTSGGSSGIDLQSQTGITIQSPPSQTTNLTTTSSNAPLQLTTTGGNIDAQGVDLTTTGSGNKGQYSDININSAGDVNLNNSKLSADRGITIAAAGNIYLQGTTITSNHGPISLVLKKNSSGAYGMIYVGGLTISPNGTATLDTTTGASAKSRVSGTPKSGSVN